MATRGRFAHDNDENDISYYDFICFSCHVPEVNIL